MRLKTDENIGRAGIQSLQNAGHDTDTVVDEGLLGAVDLRVYEACRRENRVLVTLDRGFAQVLRFAETGGPGIVILNIGRRFTIAKLLNALEAFLIAARTNEIRDSVWIVDSGRLRIRRHTPRSTP